MWRALGLIAKFKYQTKISKKKERESGDGEKATMSKRKEGRERERDRRMPRRGRRVTIADRSIAVTSVRNHSRAGIRGKFVVQLFISKYSYRNAAQGTAEVFEKEMNGMARRAFLRAREILAARMKAEGSVEFRPPNAEMPKSSASSETHSAL